MIFSTRSSGCKFPNRHLFTKWVKCTDGERPTQEECGTHKLTRKCKKCGTVESDNWEGIDINPNEHKEVSP